MLRRHSLSLTLGCLALVLAYGCGSKDDSSTAENGQSTTSGGGKTGKAPFKIVILTNGSSPFWDACGVGLKEAGAELGVAVELVRNDMTESGQIRRLEQLLAQDDVKGVGVSVVNEDAAGIAEAMKALRAKGIKVITIDSDGQKETREAFVGTNNLEGGRELGRLAAQLRPDGGKAVTFVGVLAAQNAKERIGGFKEGAGDKIQVIDSMEDESNEGKARTNTTAAIQNHPDLKILVGIWSYNAPAIADVVSAGGRRKDFTIVTFDAEPNAIVAMSQGNIDAMVVQNPHNMGYTGCKLLYRMITDDKAGVEEILKGGDVVDTGLKVIVPNAESPLKSPFRMTLGDFQGWLTEKGLTGS